MLRVYQLTDVVEHDPAEDRLRHQLQTFDMDICKLLPSSCISSLNTCCSTVLI